MYMCENFSFRLKRQRRHMLQASSILVTSCEVISYQRVRVIKAKEEKYVETLLSVSKAIFCKKLCERTTTGVNQSKTFTRCTAAHGLWIVPKTHRDNNQHQMDIRHPDKENRNCCCHTSRVPTMKVCTKRSPHCA